MEDLFIVSALPKSGTSMVSVAMNTLPGIFCYHDSVELFDNPNEAYLDLKDKFLAVGDSSTAAFLPQFDDIEARRITIKIDPWESHSRSEQFIGSAIPKDGWQFLVDCYNSWCDKHQPIAFSRDVVFTPPGLSAIAKACVPDFTPNEEIMNLKFSEILRNKVEPYDNTYDSVTSERLRRIVSDAVGALRGGASIGG